MWAPSATGSTRGVFGWEGPVVRNSRLSWFSEGGQRFGPLRGTGSAGSVSDTGSDVEGPKSPGLVGAKSAMSELSPAGKVIVVVAVPLVRVTGSPRVVLLSLNCTAPVAVVGVIVAVSVSVVGGSAGEAGVISRVVVVVVVWVAGVLVIG